MNIFSKSFFVFVVFGMAFFACPSLVLAEETAPINPPPIITPETPEPPQEPETPEPPAPKPPAPETKVPETPTPASVAAPAPTPPPAPQPVPVQVAAEKTALKPISLPTAPSLPPVSAPVVASAPKLATIPANPSFDPDKFPKNKTMTMFANTRPALIVLCVLYFLASSIYLKRDARKWRKIHWKP